MGIWTRNAGWKLLKGFDTTQSKLQGLQLTVATLPAMKITTKSKINGSAIYSGLYIDYLNLLADDLNFTYSIVEPEDGVYGSDFDGDGQWNGIIGMAQRGEIDINGWHHSHN